MPSTPSSPDTPLLVYGANGYTGELIAREAVARGLRPTLAGRRPEPVAALATELGLPHRVFGLDDGSAIAAGLEGMKAVIHCAGPFARTSPAMVEGCLARHVHYLDITGEVEVFEACATRDAEAKAAGIMLLPGVGFDVVPSDCLGAHLKARLPAATALALGFLGTGGVSHGTATTMAENVHRGGLVRRGGRLTPVPAGHKTRTIDFGRGPMKAVTIPWGDVSTAWWSTGIPDIEVYMAAPTSMRVGLSAARHLGWLLGSGPVQSFIKGRIPAGGPTVEQRQRSRSYLWGEARATDGRTVTSRIQGPDGYTLTVDAALLIAERVLGGAAPDGFQTPSKAYGPDLVLDVAGTSRSDNP